MKIIQDCKACEKDSKTCQCICLDLAANQSEPVMIRVDLEAVDDESRAPINQFCLGCAEYNANQFPCSGSSDCVDDCYTPDPNLAAAPTSHSVPAVESWPPVSSFLSAYVLIIFTNNGKSHRYFCGFGKGKRLQSAWSLAGARLFLIDNKEQTNSGSEMVNAEFVLATKGIKFERRVVSLRSAEASK